MPKEYYFCQFSIPTSKPFDDSSTRWPSFVAEFIRPVVAGEKQLLFWFTYYGDYAQVCFYTESFDPIKGKIDDLNKKLGTSYKHSPNPAKEALVGAFGGSRFLSDQTKDPAHRSELVLRFLHSVAELYIDNLIPVGNGYWSIEKSVDRENPLGNNFESLAHLMANATGFEFDLNVTAQTAWMSHPARGLVRCSL